MIFQDPCLVFDVLGTVAQMDMYCTCFTYLVCLVKEVTSFWEGVWSINGMMFK